MKESKITYFSTCSDKDTTAKKYPFSIPPPFPNVPPLNVSLNPVT